MMNYQFDKQLVSQHIIKYGVHIQPAITLKDDKTKLQDYCNWLIEQFPEAFETLLLGPAQLRMQKSFLLANNKRAELSTFVLTSTGPVFTFPQRLFIDQPQDLDISEKDRIFRKSLDELRGKFLDRKILRVGVVHELVFDTGTVDSVEIIASNLKNEIWREQIKNLRLLLETPRQDKNINLEIKPTYLRRAGPAPDVSAEDMRFGIIVNVDINNRQIKDSLTKAQVNDILAFANDYIADELIRFLNNEYSDRI